MFDTFLKIIFRYVKRQDCALSSAALEALGFFCYAYPELILDGRLQGYYCAILMSDNVPLRTIVLHNLTNYLKHEQNKIEAKALEQSSSSRPETSLVEIDGDNKTDFASIVAQFYWQYIERCYLHADTILRYTTSSLIKLIAEQNLIHSIKVKYT